MQSQMYGIMLHLRSVMMGVLTKCGNSHFASHAAVSQNGQAAFCKSLRDANMIMLAFNFIPLFVFIQAVDKDLQQRALCGYTTCTASSVVHAVYEMQYWQKMARW